MTAFLLLLVVSAFAKDTFITLDSSRPLGLFVDVAPLNCSLVFTTDNVFFLKGTSILKSSPTNNLISDDASAQAVGLFVDPANKRVIAAIADDTGVLSFSSLTDCESPFVLLDGWTVPTEVKNLTSAVRVSADEVLFSGPSGKAVFVGWVQGNFFRRNVSFFTSYVLIKKRDNWEPTWGEASSAYSVQCRRTRLVCRL